MSGTQPPSQSIFHKLKETCWSVCHCVTPFERAGCKDAKFRWKAQLTDRNKCAKGCERVKGSASRGPHSHYS